MKRGLLTRKSKHIPIMGKDNTTEVGKLHRKWKKKGYELVNITSLCEVELGESGWCNDWNEPDEKIFHIRILYKKEIIANLLFNDYHVIDDDKYLMFVYDNEDFIIFRKVKL